MPQLYNLCLLVFGRLRAFLCILHPFCGGTKILSTWSGAVGKLYAVTRCRRRAWRVSEAPRSVPQRVRGESSICWRNFGLRIEPRRQNRLHLNIHDAPTPLQEQPLWGIRHCRGGSHDRFVFFEDNFSQSRRGTAVAARVAPEGNCVAQCFQHLPYVDGTALFGEPVSPVSGPTLSSSAAKFRGFEPPTSAEQRDASLFSLLQSCAYCTPMVGP